MYKFNDDKALRGALGLGFVQVSLAAHGAVDMSRTALDRGLHRPLFVDLVSTDTLDSSLLPTALLRLCRRIDDDVQT